MIEEISKRQNLVDLQAEHHNYKFGYHGINQLYLDINEEQAISMHFIREESNNRTISVSIEKVNKNTNERIRVFEDNPYTTLQIVACLEKLEEVIVECSVKKESLETTDNLGKFKEQNQTSLF